MKRAIITGLTLMAAACASGRGERGLDTVSDSDFGRLQPGQAQGVADARQQALQARDELARAKLHLTDTQHEEELAKADQAAADSDRKRAEAESKMGAESNEPVQKQRAQELTETAQLHRRSADAHLEYAKKVSDSRKAEVDAAQKRLALADAKENLSKLKAMQEAGIPAAGKYDMGGMSNRVNSAETAHNEAVQKARSLESEATTARERWQDLNRQLQARTSGTNRG